MTFWPRPAAGRARHPASASLPQAKWHTHTVSLADPDGFIAAVESHGHT